MLTITVNGEPREFNGAAGDALTLPALIDRLGIDTRRIAIAVNGEVVAKADHAGVTLRDGDAVEIVRMVGGGAGLETRSSKFETRRSNLDPRPSTLDPHEARSADVVIAGAGIIGCAIAYEVSRRGVSCILLDSRRVGMAATNAAGGILAPLAEFRRPGPLVDLGLRSLRRYPELVARLREEVPDVDVEFRLNGVLRVALDEAEMAELRGGLHYADELGVELVELDRALVREVEPRLSANAAGGVLCPDEGQVSNQHVTMALSRAAKQRGARIVEGAPVTGFRRKGRRVTAVRTAQGDFACDRVVLAAGPWTRPLAAKLGAGVPTKPMRGQMMALGNMATPLRQVVWGSRGYLVPRANGLVFAGSTLEDVGFRSRTTQRGLAGIRRAARELAPQMGTLQEHFTWAGLRPGSPDGLPILGRLLGWENVSVATGHFRNGILLAPITGELMADLIVDGEDAELAAFNPARFGTG